MAEHQDDQRTQVEKLQDIRTLLTKAEDNLHYGREASAIRQNIQATRHLEEMVRTIIEGLAG